MEIVDVNEVIGEMLIILHNEANRHPVTIHTEVADGLPESWQIVCNCSKCS